MPGGLQQVWDEIRMEIAGAHDFNQGEEDAQDDSGIGEPVREPEEFGIEDGEGEQEPAEQGGTDQVRQCNARGCEEVGGKTQPARGPESSHGEFDDWVADADPGVAGAAAATEEDPTEDG